MQFSNKEDFNWLKELYNGQVITMSQFQSWKKPEEGRLEKVLKENGQDINNGKWIKSLIKRHKIVRYNNPTIDANIFTTLSINAENIVDFVNNSVYPLQIINNNLWVGILRHDTNTAILKSAFNDFANVFFCAITPNEAKQLDHILVKYAKQNLKQIVKV